MIDSDKLQTQLWAEAILIPIVKWQLINRDDHVVRKLGQGMDPDPGKELNSGTGNRKNLDKRLRTPGKNPLHRTGLDMNPNPHDRRTSILDKWVKHLIDRYDWVISQVFLWVL